jgi:hypothetical protein
MFFFLKKIQDKKLSSILGTYFFLKATLSFSGTPLLSITPITPPLLQIANNGTQMALIYEVKNNTQNNSLMQFVMTPIPGVTQITDSTGVCNSSTSTPSCLLYLNFDGTQTPKTFQGGPVLTTASTSSQPNQSHSLHFTTDTPSNTVDNTWISVLIEQDPAPSASGTPPNDLSTYIKKIQKLAPHLQQFHVRVTPAPYAPHSPIYQQYADVVSGMRAAFNTPLIIGFHPDNSMTEDSCLGWGCDAKACALPPAEWGITQLSCMLNASIQTMNAITELLPPGQGFDTFSIEQSYVEPIETCPLSPPPAPQPPACLQQIKACLCPQGTQTQNGTPCPNINPENCIPGVTLASPSVTFGDVLGSYGSSDLYGPTKLDFGYPQYYNLGKKIISDYDALISGGYFPASSTSCQTRPFPEPLYVVDVDTSGSYAPEIPCHESGQVDVANIYTNPSASTPNVTLAANYLAFIMTQYPPIQEAIDTNGATVYITLSGEPNILGAPGWSLTNLYQFNYNLGINFLYLMKLYPTLFPEGIPSMQYAIWNFGSILNNIQL